MTASERRDVTAGLLSMFTLASLFVLVPLFSGNVSLTWMGRIEAKYTGFVSAFVNRVLHGSILRLVFLLIGKGLGSIKII